MKNTYVLALLIVCLFVFVWHPPMAELLGIATSDASEPSLGGSTWEYAQLEFSGFLPDACLRYTDYKDAFWRWSSFEDRAIYREGYITALKEICAEFGITSLGSHAKDEHMLKIILLDAIGSKGWELAACEEGAISVNYAGRSNGAHQVKRKWYFKRRKN